jgi:small conductance mechanosensitive channel
MRHGYLYELLRKAGLSDFGASTGEFLLVRPLKIAAIVVAAMLIARLAARAAGRSIRGISARSPVRSQSLRAEQRANTVGDVVGGLVRAAVWAVAGLVLLDQVGLNLAPLLAGAGIAGVAVGFGAQSLVKDFLSGLFILLEDQYGVGDVVNLSADTSGVVEEISLRVTRLRSLDGTVWFVPNGEVRRVGNSSMEFSRALVDVLVPYDVDIDLIRRIITEEAAAMRADPAWADHILEDLEVLGVESVAAEGVTIRSVVKTAPRQQFAVGRELRSRITARLRREGVQAPGQRVLVAPGPSTAPAEPLDELPGTD